MFPRLLALLCLLSLWQVSPAQQSATSRRRVPETCAVTNPSEHPFVPPRPYVARRGVNWFGTDRFWTFLPTDGIWGQGEKDILVSRRMGTLQGTRSVDTGNRCCKVDGYCTTAAPGFVPVDHGTVVSGGLPCADCDCQFSSNHSHGSLGQRINRVDSGRNRGPCSWPVRVG